MKSFNDLPERVATSPRTVVTVPSANFIHLFSSSLALVVKLVRLSQGNACLVFYIYWTIWNCRLFDQRTEPTRVKQLSGVPLSGMLLSLSANIRLDWKRLRGINT